jgi:hypothetical protein
MPRALAKPLLLVVLLISTLVSVRAWDTDAPAPAPQLAQSDVYVKPYVRSDGTVVRGHMRSAPDGNPYNNYSYPGNYNPYTGNTAPGNPETYLRNYNGRSGSSWGTRPYGSER